MNRIIINADDAGLHPEIDKGIQQCLDAGVVKSVSVITNSPTVNFDLIKQWNKTVGTGVHLSWLGVPWITQPYFFFSWKEFLGAFVFRGEKFRAETFEEGRAQIKKMQEHQISVSHLDSHQHVHHFPVLWNYCLQLQNEFDIPRIRCAKAKNFLLAKQNLSGITLQLLADFEYTSETLLCAALKHAGNYSSNQFAEEIKAYAGHDVEFVVHPGLSNYELNKHYAHWHFDWEKETAALLKLDLKKLMRDNAYRYY